MLFRYAVGILILIVPAASTKYFVDEEDACNGKCISIISVSPLSAITKKINATACDEMRKFCSEYRQCESNCGFPDFPSHFNITETSLTMNPCRLIITFCYGFKISDYMEHGETFFKKDPFVF